MFLIENSIPLRNGMIIRGRFQVEKPQLAPGDQLIAEKDDQRIGLVRFIGVISANYTHEPTNPRYHLSVAFDGPYQLLTGAILRKL